MAEYTDAYIYPPDIAEEFEACCFEYCKVIVTLIHAYHKADPPVPVFNYTIKGALPHASRYVCTLHEPIFRLMLRRGDFNADLQNVISGILQGKSCAGGI